MQTFTVNQLGGLKQNANVIHAVKSPVYCTYLCQSLILLNYQGCSYSRVKGKR